jgi:hypothetical protein
MLVSDIAYSIVITLFNHALIQLKLVHASPGAVTDTDGRTSISCLVILCHVPVGAPAPPSLTVMP